MQSVHPEHDALIFQPGAALPITLPFLPRALLDALQLCLGLLSGPRVMLQLHLPKMMPGKIISSWACPFLEVSSSLQNITS